MIIRDAIKDEIPLIREQRVIAYEEHATSVPEYHWNALKQAITSNKDEQPGVELIIAEENGIMVGSVALFPPQTAAYRGYLEELDYPEIRMLAVSPDARGEGVAKALMAECFQRVKAKGFHTVGLHSADYMVSAMKLYENLGFKRMPQFDFEPTNDGIIVKAYRLTFEETTSK